MFPNILKQKFNANKPYKVLHTDVTQINLPNNKTAYISAVIDEASKEIISFKTGLSANKELITDMLREVNEKVPSGKHPIIRVRQ